MNKNPKIKELIILAQLDNGSIRQVFVNKETKEAVLSLIPVMEQTIKVSETPLESIEFEKK